MSPDAVRGKRGFVKFPRHVTSRSSLKQRCQDHADERVADSVAPRVPDRTNNGVLNSHANPVTYPCRFVRLGLPRTMEALPPPRCFFCFVNQRLLVHRRKNHSKKIQRDTQRKPTTSSPNPDDKAEKQHAHRPFSSLPAEECDGILFRREGECGRRGSSSVQ